MILFKRGNRLKFKVILISLLLSFSLEALAADSLPLSAIMLLLQQNEKETVSKIVQPGKITNIQLSDGTKITIPKDAVPPGEKISLTKYKKSTFLRLEPDGLTTTVDMTLSVPVEEYMHKNSDKVVVAYIYSSESPIHDSGSEKIKAEKIYLQLSSELANKDFIEVGIKHFSLIRFSIQDSLYLPFIIESKYLQKGDVLLSLSAENYVTNEAGFDWFPGHTAILTAPDSDEDCLNGENTCNMIESVPNQVKHSKLYEDFVYVDHHVYMGARRPLSTTITESDRTKVVSWVNNQIGKPWVWLNEYDDESKYYTGFSCVGLVEAAYNSIGKPIVGDEWFTNDTILRPLDIYEKTKPVDHITVTAGDDLDIRINPVFLDQDKNWYLDYRDLSNASETSNLSFSASGLPSGATFNANNGLFEWKGIPNEYSGTTQTVNFSLSNTYDGTFYGTNTITINEQLKIYVEANPHLLFFNFDQLDISSPKEISPLKSEGIIYGSNNSKSSAYTNIQLSTNSHSASYSINLVPNGNPLSTESGVLSSAIVDDVLDISTYNSVFLSFWANSTSNPRLNSVHNCDSSFDILYRLDGGSWKHFSAFCGQHKTESCGWRYVDMSGFPINTENANTIEFAFEYYIQNGNGDSSVYYMIDDFKVTGRR
jgi:hypothetical protein